MSTYYALLLGHVVIAVLLGARCLLWIAGPRKAGRNPAPDDGSMVIRPIHLCAVLILLGAELLGLYLFRGSLELSGFALVFVVYLDAFVVLPMLAIWLLGLHVSPGWELRLSRPTAGLMLLTLCLPGVGYYGTWVEPFDLRLEQHEFKLAQGRIGGAPVRLAVMADLQSARVTEYEELAVQRLMETEPDLILIPGDIIHLESRAQYAAVVPEFRALLAKLHAPGGVYYVRGNTDFRDFEELLFEGTDVVALRDELVRVSIGGSKIVVAGLELGHHQNPLGQALLEELERVPQQQEIRVLMSHLPDALLSLPVSSRVDLVVAGHTHGGQVQVPFFGPPITLSKVPRHIAGGGPHSWQGNSIYVSRGIGVERAQAPRVRFGAPPEISLLTLTPQALN